MVDGRYVVVLSIHVTLTGYTSASYFNTTDRRARVPANPHTCAFVSRLRNSNSNNDAIDTVVDIEDRHARTGRLTRRRSRLTMRCVDAGIVL